MSFKVLIPQDITMAGKQWLQEQGCEVTVLKDSSEKSICGVIGEYDAILARTAPYTRKILEAAKKLKVIGRYGAGTDNIDCVAATELGIQVCNAPIANSNSVAEHTVTLLLACAKNLLCQDTRTRRGNFESRNTLKGTEVANKILGLIGCGNIGQRVAQKVTYGFDMRVIGYDAFISEDKLPDYIEKVNSVEEIFKTADFISLHVPLTQETKNLVDINKLNQMKSSAVLLNCARGGVVNETDLYAALKEKKIAAAGLDVFEKEPASADNLLFTLENVIVSPHNGALTYEAMDKMGLDAAKGIMEVLKGQKATWPVNHLN